VITASLANLLWLQQFFNLKFWTAAGISRRDLKLTDEITLLEQTKNKPPNNSHRQLVEIIGVPKLTNLQLYKLYISKVRCEMDINAIDNKDLAKNRNEKVRIQI
jgi:hypothetical protein